MAGWLCCVLVVLALCSGSASAQPASDSDEVGRFYVQNFAPQDYGASEQNWAFVQDERGLIYVGNSVGVLECDGVSWRLIPIPNRSAARSLAIDSEGRIFVGAEAEIGYLAPDALGRRHYVSLVEQIPGEDRDFADVWRTYALSDGVYFQSYERLFRWQEGQIKVWRPETSFYFGYAVRDTFYLQTWSGELLYMDQDTLRPAPGGTTFVGQRISELVTHGADAYLAVTREHGLTRCRASAPEEQACVRFSPGLKDLLGESEPYSASVLGGEILAIGTIGGGVVLLDRDGHLLRILNEASGLRHDIVWSTYMDRQGGLWLGLNDGLARVNVTASVSYFDKTTGLPGNVSSVARHQGRLYAATTLGVYVLEPASEETAPRFAAVSGVRGQCWSLVSTREGLLAGCLHGVYNLDQRRLIWPYRDRHVYSLYRSGRDATRLFLGLGDGLARLSFDAGAWHDAGRFENVRTQVRTISEDEQGRLWIGTPTDGVLRLEADAAVSDGTAVSRFGVDDGLPAGWINTKTVAGQVRMISRNGAGLFSRDSQTGSGGFVPDTTFLSEGSGSIAELTEDERGRVWIVAGEASGVARPASDGGYTFAPTALRRVPHLKAYDILAEPDGPVWVGGGHGLVRLDTEDSLDPATDYPVWIRRVTSADASLYEGPHPRPDTAPDWPYRNKTLRFAYAAPRYEAPERTAYRTRLDGFDRAASGDEWSAWTGETHKEYTNLWEGRYVFRVEARDVYGIVSREDTFAFRILPPWYRTWWAYSLYGLALAAAVLFWVRSHREELRREQQISRRLREVDKLKDEFLANTSHELRTPLYGITGLAESLIDGAAGELTEQIKANLAMIAGSGRRLGQLVGDILDYSRLSHGSLKLRRHPVDLHALTEVVLTLQKPLATGKNLELSNAVPPDLPAADADEARLEQILHNLVGNAVKFTEEGHVVVSATAPDRHSPDPGQGTLVVAVEDTGIGIPEDKRERIFEAFEQGDSDVQRAFGGTGLGLTVTRKLVELHGGRIWVESTVGQGTRFSFTLPVSDQETEPLRAEPRPAGEQTVSGMATWQGAVAGFGTDRDTAAPTTAPRAAGASSILVVDDEPVNLQVLSNHLGSKGYGVTLATSGPLALDLAEEHAFDLVVLDVMMPRMSGYEVCRALRQRHSMEELPVIFLTAKNQVGDLVAGLDAGGNDYLAKPISKKELLARVRTHLELLSVHRRLAAKNAELARINYTVAHDLKNPLTTILNFLGVARRDAASGHTERLKSDLDRLDAAAQKLRRLLDELFELSRVGIQANPPEEVAFGELVRGALAQLGAPIAERGVEVELAPDLPAVVGDRVRLQEAVRHLLDNSVRYLGDAASPRITVGVRKTGTSDGEPPTFFVRDNGIGIDPRYHERVFGLFERLDANASVGTGIGLALVKRIVEVHRGRIWVESEGGNRGSTFCFTLQR